MKNLVLGCYLHDSIPTLVGELYLLLILLYPPKDRLNLVDVLENALFSYTCTWLELMVANPGWCMITVSNWLATCFLVTHTSFLKLNFYSILL